MPEALVERPIVGTLKHSVDHENVRRERFGEDRSGGGISRRADSESCRPEAGFVRATQTDVIDCEEHSWCEL